MNLSRWPAMLAAAALLAIGVPVSAQTPPPPPPEPGAAAAAAPIPQDLLDSLLAPIALYPDELLSQILMASTYPLEVVEAARFVKANPNLKGPALDDALKDNNTWDPSVLSLTSFPQVLDMMNDKLDWTQRLGDAFLQDEAAVMSTVQSLRLRAQQAGNLQSNEQQQVSVQQQVIYIQPAQPQYVYVPVYNPVVIYGPWWAPAYPPWFWYPPPIWGYPPYRGGAVFVGFYWGPRWVVSVNNWGWCRPDWRARSINIHITSNNIWVNRPAYRDAYRNDRNWSHNAEHRRGVAYRDAATREKYRPSDRAGVQTRENFRGRDNATRPTPGSGANVARPSPGPAQRPPSPEARLSPGQRSSTPEARPTTPAQRPSAPEARPTPAQRPSAPEARPSPGQRPSAPETRPTPAYQPQSRPQVQREATRGAQSRAAMQRPAPAANRSTPAKAPGRSR